MGPPQKVEGCPPRVVHQHRCVVVAVIKPSDPNPGKKKLHFASHMVDYRKVTGVIEYSVLEGTYIIKSKP